MANRNVLVAQSGGPSPVINSSLRGIIEGCRVSRAFGDIYAACNGIEGVLREELIDLSHEPDDEVALLSVTPAAGVIGTCRYKLKGSNREDYERVIDVLKAHQIGYLFYIGGNDSMDTASKVAELAHERGLDLVAVGVPKTIDNDLGDAAFQLLDHSPGYGSCARYWALTVQEADQENRGSFPADPVLVLQAMGRRIGFIPAAARLADPERQMPLLLFLPESSYTLEQLADLVNDKLREVGRAIVILSEGLNLGSIGELEDSFGHTQFSSSASTAAQLLVNYLNQSGLKARGAARANIPGTAQRHSIVYASTVDLAEARLVGQQAVILAERRASGMMATLLREPGPIYQVRYSGVPLPLMANSERGFPSVWIDAATADVTDDFVRYAQPLIGSDWPTIPLLNGRMRFARLADTHVAPVLPSYHPQGYR
ncbi:MAG: diphosphate--fructose-6-phosphate 1-phosphotransferase [Chloroflexi bacterium]|nr:diphosphate--fructose-6-phosphate 1-phosphotransferase [Chloroflexota bacterium]